MDPYREMFIHETEGRRLLTEAMVARGHTQMWLAKLLGVSQPCVSSWVTGAYRPEPQYRLALWLLYRIPHRAWLTKDEHTMIDRVRALVASDAAPAPGAQNAA